MKRLLLLISIATMMLSGCIQTHKELLSREWTCAGDVVINFKIDGTYKIYSNAANKYSKHEGQYSIERKLISVVGVAAYPLNKFKNVNLIESKKLILKDDKSEILLCTSI